MPSVDELAAEARRLSADDRRRLIALVEASLGPRAVDEPAANWIRQLWEETPEYRVGAAQAISVKEVQRRLAEQSWPGWFQ